MLLLLRDLLAARPRIPPEIKVRFGDESLCRRCGKCCCAAVRVKGRLVLLPELGCKYLRSLPGGKTECAVYPFRTRTGFCFHLNEDSIQRELFPPDCPYVQGVISYGGKIELLAEEFAGIKPILRNIFRLVDRPEYIRQRDWERFLYGTLELPRPHSSPASASQR